MAIILEEKLIKVECPCGCTFGILKYEISGNKAKCPRCERMTLVHLPYEYVIVNYHDQIDEEVYYE